MPRDHRRHESSQHRHHHHKVTRPAVHICNNATTSDTGHYYLARWPLAIHHVECHCCVQERSHGDKVHKSHHHSEKHHHSRSRSRKRGGCEEAEGGAGQGEGRGTWHGDQRHAHRHHARDGHRQALVT